jgi:hypothetical protein
VMRFTEVSQFQQKATRGGAHLGRPKPLSRGAAFVAGVQRVVELGQHDPVLRTGGSHLSSQGRIDHVLHPSTFGDDTGDLVALAIQFGPSERHACITLVEPGLEGRRARRRREVRSAKAARARHACSRSAEACSLAFLRTSRSISRSAERRAAAARCSARSCSAACLACFATSGRSSTPPWSAPHKAGSRGPSAEARRS